MAHRRSTTWLLGAFLTLAPASPSGWSQTAPPAQEPRPALPEAAPLPPPRPQPETASGAASEPAQAAPELAEESANTEGPAEATCPARLSQMGVRFEERPALADGACQATDVVLVAALPGPVEVTPPAVTTCPFAEALARWAVDHVTPEAERNLGEPPRTVRIGTAYQCRGQRSGSKLSEHAFANAVDVMGFTFAARPPLSIAAHPENSPEENFQAAIRRAACQAFTTVLGPGADSDHDDHLHLDARKRRGDFRICQ